MKSTPTEVQDLQVGDRVLGSGEAVGAATFEVIKHVLPFNEGDTFLVIFKNVDGHREELTRYLPRTRKFAVLTP
jgi:hypothetical protein